MGKWEHKEKKRLALALHQRHWTYPEMARRMGNRDAKKCKSHLQKVIDTFAKFHSEHLPLESSDQETVYTSNLLYLTHYPISPSPNETYLKVNRRPLIQLDERNPPEHVEAEPDFWAIGDLWTTTSTSTHGQGNSDLR